MPVHSDLTELCLSMNFDLHNLALRVLKYHNCLHKLCVTNQVFIQKYHKFDMMCEHICVVFCDFFFQIVGVSTQVFFMCVDTLITDSPLFSPIAFISHSISASCGSSLCSHFSSLSLLNFFINVLTCESIIPDERPNALCIYIFGNYALCILDFPLHLKLTDSNACF